MIIAIQHLSLIWKHPFERILEKKPYTVIHEDDNIIVVNKSNNLLVHHSYYARNIREDSLVQHLRESGDVFPVHRLDRKTSGVMVFARDKGSARSLQEQFEAHTIEKTYVALVRGFTEERGLIDSPIKNADTGTYSEAMTHFETIESVESNIPVSPYESARYSLIKFNPDTGRMHQLRKHANKISHPIIGDPKYGNRHHNHMFEDKFGHSLLYLHARAISFKVGESKYLFKAAFPGFWDKNLATLGFQYDIELI